MFFPFLVMSILVWIKRKNLFYILFLARSYKQVLQYNLESRELSKTCALECSTFLSHYIPLNFCRSAYAAYFRPMAYFNSISPLSQSWPWVTPRDFCVLSVSDKHWQESCERFQRDHCPLEAPHYPLARSGIFWARLSSKSLQGLFGDSS